MQITPLGIVATVLLATAASAAAGYVAGINLGGKDLGNSLAGFLGTLYGPIAGATGVIIGVCVLAVAARS